MSNIELIFFIILFTLTMGKWTIIVMSFIPLRVIMKRFEANALSKLKRTKVVDIKSSEDTEQRSIQKTLMRYISGYVRFVLFQIGFIPSHFTRDFIYKNIFLVKLSTNAVIYWKAEIRAPYRLVIGEGSIIGDGAILDARNGIIIGDNVNLSSNVSLWTMQHDHRDPYFGLQPVPLDRNNNILVEDRVWIGPNVTILPNVTIHEGAVIAAGTVVTKDVDPYTIVAGIPAKKIGERNQDLHYQFNGKYTPFY